MIADDDAAHGATNAHGAVIATRPASMPLHDIEMSGFPYLALVHAIAVTKPKHAGEQRVDRDDARCAGRWRRTSSPG